ncbi:glycosyltransferase [Profundibacterium mesophilum]|uniref:N-acetyllactosaminide 3-alpha-galactosyltransferase n=1 Tax=Profundibacterium mesophilum KAUST100406-0324 TaxID=1037889 RepID=A0A921NSA2_9RHOB|nr:glycosyltransferase [Profundibacterium mesophilum]KAF0676937.1 N-acetyllactosaminide 3-alpha-galactosyltransferase [Profundibacterium mesophilum KAUST100406-0324]
MQADHVVVINDAAQARGGATGLALLSVRLLRARGLRVSYVCGDAGANDELRELGVEVIAGGGAGLLRRGRADAMLRGLHNPASRAMLRDAIARLDTPGTVYHLHGWAQILSPSIFSALAPVAARTVIHAHDMFLACPNGVYMDYPRAERCLRVPLGRDCLATNCDKRSRLQKGWRVLRQVNLRRRFPAGHPWGAVVPIHPGMIPGLTRAGYPETLMHVIRNPATPYSTQRIRAEENRAIVYVGRLERDKGALDLALAARRADVPLTLVGEGSLRAEIEQANPEARITGWTARAEIAAHVSDARALVMPSHHPEPFALVLPEASGSGLPLLVSRTALMAPEIAKAGLGLAFDMAARGGLDAALSGIVQMPDEEVARISRRGHARTAPLALSEEGWTAALTELYDALCRQAARLSA